MSQISNRHTVNLFVAGKSAALNDQRLMKCGYKTTKKVKAKYPSICVSVPVIPAETIIEHAEVLIPYVRNMLESAQDGVLRSMYEAANGNLSSIGDSDIGIAQCIAWREADANGGRLTTAAVETWFDEVLKDNLTVVFAEKLGTEDTDDKRVIQALNSYRGMYASLAGGKTALRNEQINGLRRALVVSSVDDEMSGKLNMRLDNMEKEMNKVVKILEL